MPIVRTASTAVMCAILNQIFERKNNPHRQHESFVLHHGAYPPLCALHHVRLRLLIIVCV